MAADDNCKPKIQSTGIIPGQFRAANPPKNTVSANQAEFSLVQSTGKRTPFLDNLMAYFAVEPLQFSDYGEAIPYVKELVEIEYDYNIEWNKPGDRNDALEMQVRRRRNELLQIICRDYPETAKKLLLQDLVLPRAKANRSAKGVKRKAANGATVIGQNIDKFRKECGWSFDKLSEKTGIDKKLTLSHVNQGVRPVPRILKEYAQAFSKELERRITAPDLEK